MRWRTRWGVAVTLWASIALASADPASAFTQQTLLVGDCNRDGHVDVVDLVTQVNVLNSMAPETDCEAAACFAGPSLPPAFGVNCLMQAVHNAMTE